MRGFGGRQGEGTDYNRGFVAGVLATVGTGIALAVVARLAKWLHAGTFVENVSAVMTAPMFSPADILTGIAILLIIGMMAIANTLCGGSA